MGAGEIGGGVDAERHGIDDGRVDAHAVFQRAELLELLALLKRRRRQRDVAIEDGAAIGVEPDVMIERTRSIRGGGAGEIKDAEDAGVFFRQTRRRADPGMTVDEIVMSRANGARGAIVDRALGEKEMP